MTTTTNCPHCGVWYRVTACYEREIKQLRAQLTEARQDVARIEYLESQKAQDLRFKHERSAGMSENCPHCGFHNCMTAVFDGDTIREPDCYRREIAQLKAEVDGIKWLLSSSDLEVTGLRAQLASAEETIRSINLSPYITDELEMLQAENPALRKEIARLQSQLTDQRKTSIAQANENIRLHAQLDTMAGSHNQVMANYDKEIANQRDQLHDADVVAKSLREKLSEANRQLSEANQSLARNSYRKA